MLTLMMLPQPPGARGQADRELREFAQRAVDLDRAAMLLGDELIDVIGAASLSARANAG
jgi:hypothetical protein